MTNQSRNRLKLLKRAEEGEVKLIEETEYSVIMRDSYRRREINEDYEDCNLIAEERTLQLLRSRQSPLPHEPLVTPTSLSLLSSSRRKRVHCEKLASPQKMCRRAAGIPLTFLCLLASLLIIPSPVISVTPTNSDLVTEDIEISSNEYPTTASSVTPVKLQSVPSFTSGSTALGGGLSGETSSIFPSTIDDKSTIIFPVPTISNGQVQLGKQSKTTSSYAGWRDREDQGSPNGSSSLENDSADEERFENGKVDKIREYQFKSAFPEEKNETREALQEEGSNHQPVVFVGGPGYVPPNSLRARPPLEANPLWETQPIETRYPVPHHSPWDRNYRNPFNMTRVQHIEAECKDEQMIISVRFNGSFYGLIYSSGYSYDPDCLYVNGTGKDLENYNIKLNRCGTLGASNHVEGRKEPSKNFMWNTVTVQYNPMIEEEWDEHFKVTCEYGYDFYKTVTFPFINVDTHEADPVTFTLTPPECYMEIRYGFGTSGTRVGGPVRVGDPLTLMINMRSQFDGFDIVVNDCYAHNGATKKIQLIDHYGCPVDSKLMSPFRGTWSHSGIYETQVFAYLKTFRFTGSPALYIECDVRMCHGQCPSQPCYWRNVKSIRKRSADDEYAIESDRNSSVSISETTNLFQSLRVLDQEDGEAEANRSDLSNHESVCVKTGIFTAVIGLGTLILVIFGISTMLMCFRLRRVKSIGDTDGSDILRPYSHHANPPHHWSSSSISKR